MKRKDVYIHYSPATDVTGQKLQEALGINGGRNQAPKSAKMVIGWGAKTKKDIDLGETVVYNHPNSIRGNRNKLNALSVMRDGGANVAPFVRSEDIIASLDNGSMVLPVIGRTKFHQGGKGFWDCPTRSHIQAAIEDGAQYFQNLIEIKTEFRLHVVDGEVVYAVKKVKRTKEEFEAAFIEDELSRQKTLAAKNGDEFDEGTARLFLRRQAKNAVAGGANMMVRSNKMGWKFSRITKINPAVKEEAVKALAALGLTFGAVDCCLDVNDNAYIIEVNTGPGLEGTTFTRYVEAFEKLIDGKTEDTKKSVGKKAKSAASAAAGGPGSTKAEAGVLSEQLKRLQDELEDCDDPDKLDSLKRIGAKVIFGGVE